VGQDFTCGVKTDGTIACWGADDLGQLRPPPGTFTAISAGDYYACALGTDGVIACWGDDSQGVSHPPMR
jgi:alpha-tubulin suppressor-like RCC1 family protein